jgi:hypothetical protein
VTLTTEGAARLAAKGIVVPKDFKLRPKRSDEYYGRPDGPRNEEGVSQRAEEGRRKHQVEVESTKVGT